jgi:alkanesulfonate monooxygenase SsuD/methylene tetrahydromethanopterin reductase-like flavin-dependent oxidoreductase (luciferase family)
MMLRLCGEQADGTILWMTGPRTVGDHVAPRLAKAAADAGRPAPRIVATLPVAVTNDPDGSRRLADEVFQIYGNLPSYRAMLDKEGAAGPGDVAIVGDEATVTAGIQAMANAGTTEFVAAPFGDEAMMARTSELLLGLR